MSRFPHFHLPPEEWREPYVLEGEEAHHLLRVLRARPGEEVRLFDGRGRTGRFVLLEGKGGRARLEAVEIREASAAGPGVWLALGWNKSSRRGWLLEKAVELGAGGIWFWQADRSQGRPPDEPKETWRAQLLAGAKQSGNPWLPELAVLPGGPDELIRRAGQSTFDRRLLLWEDSEKSRLLTPGDLLGQGAGRTLAVLGPEGGLTPAEAETFRQAGFAPVSLGPRALRWETAALLCLGLAFWAEGAALVDATES